MLIEFCLSNYKNYRNEVCFSLEPSSKVNEFNYSILKENINNKNYEALSLSILYGSNGSGKSNLFSSIELLKNIILSGTIEIEDNKNNVYAYYPDLITNIQNVKEPVGFKIKFVNDNTFFNYQLFIQFPDKRLKINGPRIEYEELIINDDCIYKREQQQLTYLNLTPIESKLDSPVNDLTFLQNRKLNALKPFFTSFFDQIISSEIAASFISWFKSKLILLKFNSAIFKELKKDSLELSHEILRDLSKIINMTNSTTDLVGIFSPKDSKEAKLTSYVTLEDDPDLYRRIPVDRFESDGTQQLINLVPEILNALRFGKTIIIDELDTAIQTTIIFALISVFHYNELNDQNAQLIFSTHNPTFLFPDIIRSDEIYFIDFDENKIPELYSLSSFADEEVDDDLLTNRNVFFDHYMNYEYGALNNYNFIEVFSNWLGKKNQENIK